MRDDQDFADYVAANGDRLLRIAYLITGDRTVAQDVVQSVLGRALLSWGRIAKDSPDAYLRRAILNERTSLWRRWGRREVATGSLPVQSAADTIGASDGRAELVSVLHQLPPGQRAAVVLRYLEDLPDAQIADILQCSPATVRSQVSRGLSKLRSLLDLADEGQPSVHEEDERIARP